MTHPWKKHYPSEGGEFVKLEINMPRELRMWLDLESKRLKLPPWRLVCIALDNERDEANPFNYPLDFPKTVYVDLAYNDEAFKLYKFLEKFKYGLGKEVIMMFRRQIGIPNKTTLLLALRELLMRGLVLESTDFPKRNYMEYPEGYTVIRSAKSGTASPRKVDAEKNKLQKLEARLKRQRKKIEYLEGTIIKESETDAEEKS